MDYHDKKFKVISTSDEGDVVDGMIFHYQQENNVLVCSYQGGSIHEGQLIGLVADDGSIQFTYQQITLNGEIKTGRCASKPEIMENGKIRLHEKWEWTSGGNAKGESILEEVD